MDLLDKIAEYSCVCCLSDLKSNYCWKSAVQLIDASDYPLKDWNAAILYLCCIDKQFDTAEKAKEFLVKNLEVLVIDYLKTNYRLA